MNTNNQSWKTMRSFLDPCIESISHLISDSLQLASPLESEGVEFKVYRSLIASASAVPPLVNTSLSFKLGFSTLNIQQPQRLLSHHSNPTDKALQNATPQKNFFFNGSNYQRFPNDIASVNHLRTRLSKLLYNHLEAELPRQCFQLLLLTAYLFLF
jgi:hypothetical protein